MAYVEGFSLADFGLVGKPEASGLTQLDGGGVRLRIPALLIG